MGAPGKSKSKSATPAPPPPAPPMQSPGGDSSGFLAGTITRGEDRFGYLHPDDGSPDVFVMPSDCVAFGKVIPPKGTRVLYVCGIDKQKGLPKAEEVQPENFGTTENSTWGQANKGNDKGKGGSGGRTGDAFLQWREKHFASSGTKAFSPT